MVSLALISYHFPIAHNTSVKGSADLSLSSWLFFLDVHVLVCCDPDPAGLLHHSEFPSSWDRESCLCFPAHGTEGVGGSLSLGQSKTCALFLILQTTHHSDSGEH